MAKFANTSLLDVNAEVYSDEENASSSGSVAEESDSSEVRYGDLDGDDGGDSAAPEVRAPIINRIQFSVSGKPIFEPDTPPSDASSDFDLADFDEQAPAPDAAKTGEASSANAELIKISDSAGPEIAKLAESSSTTPEAGETAKPPSPAKAAPATPTPTMIEIPATDATPAVDLAMTDVAAV